eukprot:TRINITY_DN13774_c0_g1_i1.p1 TRINITY_DN13774_c0_g1~~TRINITY_DN13774_c0_g1_i1.p1  ORF type:complete len:78 (+),score=9.42 TRINITY_DN13774_c0_g1_i1:289-522(+)
MLKACSRLHKELGITMSDFDNDLTAKGIFENTIDKESDIPAVSTHLTHLQQKHRKVQLTQLIEECKKALRRSLGHTV